MTGATLSFTQVSIFVTVTVKLQVAVKPFTSVALYLTVVVPTGKHEPFLSPAVGDETTVIVKFGQLSVAVGSVQFATEQVSNVVAVKLAGQFVMVG